MALYNHTKKPLTNDELKRYWVMSVKELNDYCLDHALNNLSSYSLNFVAKYFKELTADDLYTIKKSLGEEKSTKLFVKLLGKCKVKKLVNRLIKIDGKDSFISCEGKSAKARGIHNEIYYIYKMNSY